MADRVPRDRLLHFDQDARHTLAAPVRVVLFLVFYWNPMQSKDMGLSHRRSLC